MWFVRLTLALACCSVASMHRLYGIGAPLWLALFLTYWCWRCRAGCGA
jgi:hypothetical protein